MNWIATLCGFFYFLHLQKTGMGIFKRFFSKEKLDKGLEPSKQSILDKIGKAVAGKSTVDTSVLDQLEGHKRIGTSRKSPAADKHMAIKKPAQGRF